MPNPTNDPWLPQQQDTTLYWWQGRPCRILKKLSFGDRALVQIEVTGAGGHKRMVGLEELQPRAIYNIPANFQQVLEILRDLLMKLGSDPRAGEYNVDVLIEKLQGLSDAITGLNQQLQSVQWGNVQGNIDMQPDLMTKLNQRVSVEQFPELFNIQMQRYLHSLHHQQPLPPFS